MMKFFAILIALADRFNEWFSDDEPFDAEWMDAKAWLQTRI